MFSYDPLRIIHQKIRLFKTIQRFPSLLSCLPRMLRLLHPRTVIVALLDQTDVHDSNLRREHFIEGDHRKIKKVAANGQRPDNRVTRVTKTPLLSVFFPSLKNSILEIQYSQLQVEIVFPNFITLFTLLSGLCPFAATCCPKFLSFFL